MNIILFLDFFTCVGIIVSLNLVSKERQVLSGGNYRAWIVYMIASLTQFVVCTCGPKVIPGLGLMAAILFFTGWKNYRIARKLAKKECEAIANSYIGKFDESIRKKGK